jgi:hypothetical protein
MGKWELTFGTICVRNELNVECEIENYLIAKLDWNKRELGLLWLVQIHQKA